MEIKPAVQFPLADLGALFTNAFEGYIGGSFTIDGPVLADFVLRDGASLNLSLVGIQDDGTLTGFVLVVRRGVRTRIAGMGVAKAFQGQGVGRKLMERALADSSARGDSSIELEVIQQNEPALKLYESLGFERYQELIGFTSEALKESGEARSLTEIDLLDVARDYAGTEDHWLPWQCASWTLATATIPGSRAFAGEGWKAIISNPTNDTVAIRAIAVAEEQRRRGIATRCVSELRAAMLTKTFKVSAICPKIYSEIFLRNGFKRDEISQFHMRIVN